MDKDKQGTLAFVRIVGQRVRERREAGGLTQSRLERDAELRPTTIARLERGEEDLAWIPTLGGSVNTAVAGWSAE